jgi:hypothetical protein
MVSEMESLDRPPQSSARPGRPDDWDRDRACATSTTSPCPACCLMIHELAWAHYETDHGPRTPASARDTTWLALGRTRSMALGRSVMKRIRIVRQRVRSERPWPEVLAPDPRDPDIVRAKALARAARSREASEK